MEAFLFSFDDLLDFDPVRDITLVVDSPSQVPRSREVPVSPCNDHNRELVSTIHEVFLEYVALDDRHDPFFALQSRVEFSDEEIIEHCLIVPGLERFHLFFG